MDNGFFLAPDSVEQVGDLLFATCSPRQLGIGLFFTSVIRQRLSMRQEPGRFAKQRVQ